jgi:hypothetical protein
VNINLHIERLVLDGLPLKQSQGPRLQAAVERELTRLLTGGQLTTQFHSGGTYASVKGSPIRFAERTNPSRLGEQIAAAVYSGFGGEQ